MRDKKIILAPAKLNIFLKVMGKRKDGYHEIRSGITLINLFDEIEIEKDNKTSVNYTGYFKPKNGFYEDCIVDKTLNFLDIKIKLKININKNIPVQGGLGSASTNAAAIIKALEEMHLIEQRKPAYYVSLGADVPFFLFQKDSFVTGIGEKLLFQPFPKYFFLLVKPKFTNSTKKMYDELDNKYQVFDQDLLNSNSQINEEDVGNDFEEVVIKKSKEYEKIFDFLENLDHVIFVRMTGSGSCCYAVFDKEVYALKAKDIFKSEYQDLWVHVCENNTINN